VWGEGMGYLELRDLRTHFSKRSGGAFSRRTETVRAVDGVSLSIEKGEIFGLVGESGCGKSTLCRTVMQLVPPTSGSVILEGEDLSELSRREMRRRRLDFQMVFQDPYSSLNPRMSVFETLEEPIRFHNPGISRSEATDRVTDVMKQVGVDPDWRTRYPHEFSGGQRQRISIARALAVDPEFIVADEPIAALDVSIQAQILNLMMDLQDERGLTYMFISHDLSVVEHISTNVAVMYLGTLCEFAETETLYSTPRHPYTRALLSAIPKLGKKDLNHVKLKGDVPTPIQLPPGCVFHGRCPFAEERCRTEIPQLTVLADGSRVACHGVEENRIPS
jgi:peptide/nickel transport system ATP-binding protein